MNLTTIHNSQVQIPIGDLVLEGALQIPESAQGLVVFVHGSGSSRHSRRNQQVATFLQSNGLATLLFDLLTSEEERIDMQTRHLRFDIELLASRVIATTDWLGDWFGDWLGQEPLAQKLAIGYFGASTGAAAALLAAAARPNVARAVVSRGGRPDLAASALPVVRAPTLLIVGGDDIPVIDMNNYALGALTTTKKLEIIPGATHLFEEAGALEAVARLASDWFQRYLIPVNR